MPSRRSIFVLVFFSILSIVGFTAHRAPKGSPDFLQNLGPPKTSIFGAKGKKIGEGNSDSQACGRDIKWLDELDLIYPITYAQREVIVRPIADLDRKSLTKVKERIFPKSKSRVVSKNSTIDLGKCQPPLTLDVPLSPATVNASHMAFGIATTLDRLEESTPYFARWLANTGAKLFAVAMKPEKGDLPSSKEMSERESKLRGQGMDITILPPLNPDEQYTETYFSLVRVLFKHSFTAQSSWFVLMDDDTFFPSMPSLLSMLAKYDTLQPHWVGAISENWWSVARYGLMAFGGGGIFLSRPLVHTINDFYDACVTEMHPAAGGDERLMRCIHAHTQTKLTNEPDLHQMDIFGDLSGLYEAGRMPLSLHHWKGTEYPVRLMSLVSDICGDCVLQRWQFGDDTVLTNGFSVAVYPEGKKANGLDFDKAEATWDAKTVEGSVNSGADHSMSPARDRLVLDQQKIQYKLVESAISDDGSVRQTYVHKVKQATEEVAAEREVKKDEGDTVLVLYWKNEDQPTTMAGTNTTAQLV
ncbi:MAG: hypothetical protein Q9220_007544 [cf. Caloplaca sp. 1 TL-2023]